MGLVETQRSNSMLEENKKMCNEISNYISLKSLCKFYRKRLDANSQDGYPLLVSDELCLLSYEYNLVFDGYKIIRIKDIS